MNFALCIDTQFENPPYLRGTITPAETVTHLARGQIIVNRTHTAVCVGNNVVSRPFFPERATTNVAMAVGFPANELTSTSRQTGASRFLHTLAFSHR